MSSSSQLISAQIRSSQSPTLGRGGSLKRGRSSRSGEEKSRLRAFFLGLVLSERAEFVG